ncbi:MAG TPA: hypothetical protein VGE72_05180 [Azospirillum sp.]
MTPGIGGYSADEDGVDQKHKDQKIKRSKMLASAVARREAGASAGLFESSDLLIFVF